MNKCPGYVSLQRAKHIAFGQYFVKTEHLCKHRVGPTFMQILNVKKPLPKMRWYYKWWQKQVSQAGISNYIPQ